ncbi:unnamed protein product [Clonostachys chloroleuca]|uniref:N-acetyltransferase domain-containing protein n=1 Tax=Clonostachys chloroleuca TaxID=1926264 RepID=A0AA35PXK4_9HYPO|nr:unnamed protein product [Clonostachys chloroleuca]
MGVTNEITFRDPRPGDFGYIIHRHGQIYCQEYGWDGSAEIYFARAMTDFMENFNPVTDRIWIAERNDEFIGCVAVCRDQQRKDTARLRFLIVEPTARGLGLGKQLIQKTIDFAKEKGYRKMVLSTQSILLQAIRLYTAAGFRKICDENDEHFKPHNSHGELWGMDL